ncbi:MAG: hypothetical protein LBT23_06895 [Synergistaceae bacterium]|nr:hypothetical protein [Synergistaceae bacterium]
MLTNTFITLAIFCVLIYFMFGASRTALWVLGWVIFASMLFVLLNQMNHGSGNSTGAEATKTINDLRNLKKAAILFQGEHGRPPLPREIDSLDQYIDPPIVARVFSDDPYRRYTNIMLSELTDVSGYTRRYVGVELNPEVYGNVNIQKKIAARTDELGLFQETASGNEPPVPYKSGLNVYMEIR